MATAQVRAAWFMLASTLGFGMMAVTIRLASAEVPTTEVAFFRNAFGLLALLPLLLRAGPRVWKTGQLPRYALRAGLGLCSMLCGFWAVGHLPLSQAVSISYSTPVFVTIAAALWLGESVRMRRWAAVAAGFAGVLLIVRPGHEAFNFGLLVPVAAAILSALVAIQIKQLTRIDSPDTVVLYTYLFWVPLSLIPALFQWVWPSGITWLWLLGTGLFGTIGQLFWTRALKLGDVSALTPISFSQLPLVCLVGWLWFGEVIDAWTIAGAAVILGSNAYIAHREALLARRAASIRPNAGTTPDA